MAVTQAARMLRRPGVLAWALWVLVVLGLAAGFWLEGLLRRAGRADPLDTAVGPTVAIVSAATVGTVLAGRRPRHPVGWLLLAFALSLAANGVAGGYAPYGLLARPGALPAAAWVARYYPATALVAFACLGLVLLLVPTGSPPSPRWRWWAWLMVGALAVLLLAMPLAPGRRTGATSWSTIRWTCGRSTARCWGPTRPRWPSLSWASWSAPGRWWCGSAAPAAPSASSFAGWSWPPP
jgi:hypothetical protein